MEKSKRQRKPNTRLAIFEKIDVFQKSPKEKFGLSEQLSTKKFNHHFVNDMRGKQFTVEYLRENGFKQPVRFLKKAGLGVTVPSTRFTVKHVLKLVGEDRKIHVQCCKEQETKIMTMKSFVNYYMSNKKTNKDKRQEILNVLSLEFTDTNMNSMVERPKIVNQIDWIDTAVPTDFLKTDEQKLRYPVRKYCLMSVAGSYTTFHVDFGGTSVWYHVLKGKKIFWLIPPTKENLEMFEKWSSSVHEDEKFLGDLVDQCQRVELGPGNTFLMPSGWIHAVYTPKDSLVFGGNFLHSFNVPMQQTIVALEDRIKVPKKQRFPHLTELQWYLLDYYSFHLTGKSYLDSGRKGEPQQRLELSSFELDGIYNVIDALKTNTDKSDTLAMKDMDDLIDHLSHEILKRKATINECEKRHENNKEQLTLNNSKGKTKRCLNMAKLKPLHPTSMQNKEIKTASSILASRSIEQSNRSLDMKIDTPHEGVLRKKRGSKKLTQEGGKNEQPESTNHKKFLWKVKIKIPQLKTSIRNSGHNELLKKENYKIIKDEKMKTENNEASTKENGDIHRESIPTERPSNLKSHLQSDKFEDKSQGQSRIAIPNRIAVQGEISPSTSIEACRKGQLPLVLTGLKRGRRGRKRKLPTPPLIRPDVKEDFPVVQECISGKRTTVQGKRSHSKAFANQSFLKDDGTNETGNAKIKKLDGEQSTLNQVVPKKEHTEDREEIRKKEAGVISVNASGRVKRMRKPFNIWDPDVWVAK